MLKFVIYQNANIKVLSCPSKSYALLLFSPGVVYKKKTLLSLSGMLFLFVQSLVQDFLLEKVGSEREREKT